MPQYKAHKMDGTIEVPTSDDMDHKQSTKYAGNHYGKGFANPDKIQERQMPVRKGYDSDKTAGPSTAKGPHNVESGKRKWTPEEGQNYVGNPDKINVGASRNRTGNLK